ncbi:MAG: DUF1667 domain-containing protein [Bacillota bacterium]
MKKEMICIVCPVGCHLSIDTETLEVTGNRCPRGETYAKKEITNPTRVVTSTVKINSNLQRRVSVKTSGPIPKGNIFDLMDMLNSVELDAPVEIGDVVLENVFDSGEDVIVTMKLEE